MYMILHLPMICNSKFTYLLQKSIHKYILAIKGGLPMPAMLNALVLPKKCGSHVIEILTNRSIKEGVSKCTPSFFMHKAPTFTSWGFVIT